MDKWDLSRVWWCDEFNLWAVTCYDSEGNSVSTDGYNDECEFYHYKRDAVHTARGYKDSGRCNTVRVETK